MMDNDNSLNKRPTFKRALRNIGDAANLLI